MPLPHILYSGLDWLGVDVKLEDQAGHNAFLNDIDRIFTAKPESKVSYLGKEWRVHLSPNNKNYCRYLNGTDEGFTLYLDNRIELGFAWPIQIDLGKPKSPNQSLPSLWINPFHTMKELLARIEGYYGEVYHRVQRS